MKKEKGFTLIELVIIVAIVCILGSVIGGHSKGLTGKKRQCDDTSQEQMILKTQ